MTVAVHVSTEGVRLPIAAANVAEVARRVLSAERVRDAMLSIAFLPAPAMARLNREHLGHRGATDVISFGFRDGSPRGALVGDIYVSPDVARANAKEHSVPIREEIVRLVVHGTLHVLGYEHPDGESRFASPMWRRQEALVRRLVPGSAGSDGRASRALSRRRKVAR